MTKRGTGPDGGSDALSAIVRENAQLAGGVIFDSNHARRLEAVTAFREAGCRLRRTSGRPAKNVVIVAHDSTDTDLREFMSTCIDRNNPLVLYSEQPSTSFVARRIHQGAAAYLAFPFTHEQASEALSLVADYGLMRTLQLHYAAAASARLASLTRREVQVLDYMTAGLSTKAIAEQLELSRRTVDIHRGNVISKTGGSSYLAVRLAVLAGIGGGESR